MRNEKFKDSKKDGHHREHYKGKDHSSHHRGPKTFRRGRAIAFLEMMNLKRSTIKEQLDKPEFQSINQILVGELKAIDMLINEFIQLFEIQESEAADKKNVEMETSNNDEKGIEMNETN
ncbi:hypothetical protein P4534_19090 [Peribacillus butanolivorans]|uniref:hypothetical protein n=1 Tax=Peribacillus butanolivorans TaxID=421767 RepID=UPI002E219B09|nr:hypothetical protein [Peribacillus butanolivorans]